jgi:hypothetical protein
LVDYSDGELSEAEAGEVMTHLAECPECRAELRMLQRSLELARSVWQNSAAQSVLEKCAETAPVHPRDKWAETPPRPLGGKLAQTPPRPSREDWGEGFLAGIRDPRRIQAAVGLAACVAAVLLAAAGAWLFWHGRSGRELDQTELAAPLERPAGRPVSPAKQPSTRDRPVRQTDRSPVSGASEDRDVEALIARAGRAARLAAAAELLAAQPGLEQIGAEADRYLAEAYRGTPAGDQAATRVGPRATEANKEPKS